MHCFYCGSEFQSTSGSCPRCGAAQDDLPGGAVIGGKWVIERLLGSGGMGRVYLARHNDLNRLFALKILHHRYLNNRNLLKRFKAEAMAASRMDHPNIVSIVDYGVDGSGLIYITMEYLRGRSLEAIATESFPISTGRLLRIAIQICRALEEAHRHQIIHRDLKPENVMVHEDSDPPDAVKVLDFGLAKALDPGVLGGMSQITVSGSTCGTPEYMSPEQARGIELDARSDIYAMGVLLYRLVVGRPPFLGRNPVAVASAHVIEPVVPPTRANLKLKLPPRLETAILRCLEKKPDGRYDSARALRLELEEILGELEQLEEREDLDRSQRRSLPSRVAREIMESLPTADSQPAASSSQARPRLVPVPLTGMPLAEEMPPAPLHPAESSDLPWLEPPPSPQREEPVLLTGGSLKNVPRVVPDEQQQPATVAPGSISTVKSPAVEPPTQPMPQLQLRAGPAAGESAPWSAEGRSSSWELETDRQMPTIAHLQRQAGGRSWVRWLLLLLVALALVGLVSGLLLWRRLSEPTLRVTAALGQPEIQLGAEGSWKPLGDEPVLLGWKQGLRTRGRSLARIGWPSGARAELGEDARLDIGLFGVIQLVRGSLRLEDVAEDSALEVQLEQSGSRVVVRGPGPFEIRLREEGVDVANRQGIAAILVSSGQIPVEPGRMVSYRRGKPPTYTPLPSPP